MVVFAKSLNQSLSRAIAQAEQQSYTCATPEHVLLALIDDPDAVPVMRACNVDLEKLRTAVEVSMPHWKYTSELDESDVAQGSDADDAPESDEDDASGSDERIPVKHFKVDLERAIAHACSSGCEEVGSADMLIAMLQGPVGALLNEHGVTRYDATTFICHGISKDVQANSRPGCGVKESVPPIPSGDATGSTMSEIQILNDNYTSMDFVVHVLKEVFELTPEDAERVMLAIHREGAGTCGSYTREEAEARAAQVMDLARQHQHPLRCRILE